jgi:fucose 4-O-acetylase-like acetyltransferase
MSEIKAWMDSLRALAILLVIFGHQVGGGVFPSFFSFTSPIKMPLFFAISGYLYRKKRIGIFYKDVLFRLIIPWLVLGGFPCLLSTPFYGVFHTKDFLIKLLIGKVFWFMPCFILGLIIHDAVIRISRTSWHVIGLSTLAMLLGFIADREGLGEIGMINRAFVVQVFFLIGSLFKQKEKVLIDTNWCYLAFFAVLYIALCMYGHFKYPGDCIDVHLNRYFDFPLNMFCVYLGCFLFFTVFCKLNIGSRLLSFLGSNTLVLYMWHGYAISLILMILKRVGFSFSPSILSGLVLTIGACVICGGCSFVLNRFCPWTVGKKR